VPGRGHRGPPSRRGREPRGAAARRDRAVAVEVLRPAVRAGRRRGEADARFAREPLVASMMSTRLFFGRSLELKITAARSAITVVKPTASKTSTDGLSPAATPVAPAMPSFSSRFIWGPVPLAGPLPSAADSGPSCKDKRDRETGDDGCGLEARELRHLGALVASTGPARRG
jgi:hypothetical protein